MKLPVAPLTPWVAEQSRNTERVLEQTFGLKLLLSGRSKEAGVVRLLLECPAAGLTLELGKSSADQPAFARQGELALSYRKGSDGVDPYADAEKRKTLDALAATVRDLSPLATKALEAALTQHVGSAGAEDFMLRSYDPARREGTLRLGFRCNQDCGFCWQSRRWAEAPVDFYARWLDELAVLGAERLVISGGEPTLHAELRPLVARATQHYGMHVCLETNAIRLRQPDYLDELLAAGLREVFVSLHSHEPALSDELTRAPGTHAKTLQGLRRCISGGLSVTLNCALFRQTVGSLEEYARFVTEQLGGVERVVLSQPSAAFDVDWYNAHCPRLDAVRRALPAALKRLQAAGVDVECVGTCGYPPCVVEGFPELWRPLESSRIAESATARHEFVAACQGCAARAQCLGLRSEYVACHGDAGVLPLARF